MNFVRIDPPGTLCLQEALRDQLAGAPAETFIDIGCGSGTYTKLLCDIGLTGTGIDFSESALAVASNKLASFLADGRCNLIKGDILHLPSDLERVDIAVSHMVAEHVEDDVGFVRRICQFVKPGGTVILAVPGRPDLWSLEDELVGHFRRYERADLERVMRQAGLSDVSVRSVGVPTINLLFRLGARLLARSAETSKRDLDIRDRTETSGIQEIRWKTVFPSWVRLVLNRVTLYPLFVLQRLFYRTDFGVVIMGVGKASP